MNNDYNNFNRNDQPENGAAFSENLSFGSEPKKADTEHETFRAAPNSDGEYHFKGSQMTENREPVNGTGGYRASDSGQSGNTGTGSFGNTYGGAPHSGSYTYNGSYGSTRPTYGGYSAWNNSTVNGPVTPPVYEEPKKKKSGVSKGVLAVVCILCVLLSAGAGLGGAFVYDRYIADDTAVSDEENSDAGNKDSSAAVVPGENGGTTVIHRVVESDESTSTGEKGIYTDVAAVVKDSVVEITTEFKVEGFFQYVTEGAGSGVIISEDGYIITNNHVIADTNGSDVADAITVRLTNGNEYDAVLVGRDADSDIAVIKIEPDEALTYAVYGDSDKLTVGEEVIAVGNPLGELGGTVTNGIISALDREISVDGTKMNLLQTNAAINPGNSGGGLFNMKGELIGIVNAKSSGSGIEGLGFAIPVKDADKVSKELIEYGYVTGKTYIGVSFYDVTDPYTAYRYFGSQATGVYVVETVEGYNDEALQRGDRVVDIAGNEISEFAQIKDILREHEVGDVLEFTVYRKGKLTKVEVTLFEYVPEETENIKFEK